MFQKDIACSRSLVGPQTAKETKIRLLLNEPICFSIGLTEGGDVYTWCIETKMGILCRNAGSGEAATTPLKVSILSGRRVVDVACGGTRNLSSFPEPGGNAFYIALDDRGSVFTWGDGDYGKMGRGGSEGSKIPRLVDTLQSVGIERVYAGEQCGMAIARNGTLYVWGKGERFLLGFGLDEHVRYVQLLCIST